MAKKRWYAGKYLWLGLIFLGSLVGFGAYKFFSVKADKPTYIFGAVEHGDIIVQVGASGTLAAINTVQVGSQVSGTIAELYADFNSEVKQGQLLVKLDPEVMRAQVEQQEANVRAAESNLNDVAANIVATRANLEKGRVDMLDKTRRLKRTQELFEEKLVPRDDLETAQANLDAAIASQKAIEAQLISAQARQKADESRLTQARANLRSAQLNLEHTIITSPISGTIISRDVGLGQTVAASFSAPTLFTIAADLTQMQVSTSIDEADVGKIHNGMEAIFTVDAYPGESFYGTISQVRLSPTTVQNVVTYNAMIDVPNPQLKLKPGMTANVKIVVEKAEGVLKIPNSALRFKPTLSDAEMEQAFKAAGEEKYWKYTQAMGSPIGGAAPGSAPPAGAAAARSGGRQGMPGGMFGMNMRGGNGGNGNRAPSAANRANRGRRVPIWIAGPNESLRPVVVKLGLSDGVNTEIDGKLKPGDKIIVGMEVAETQSQSPMNTRPPGFGGPGGFRR
jgi:HlyD family secretion protein